MRRLGFATALVLAALVAASEWFVHHPKPWVDDRIARWPRFATAILLGIGNPAADLTDAFGWTGTDALVRSPRAKPSGRVFFAGAPKRTGAPAPRDIQMLDRGEFIVGWSPSLGHPSWCAYHVPAKAFFNIPERPAFKKDDSAPQSPRAADYARTGYDRGHMAPNYAIASRFGPEMQRKTFLMSNIAPQSPSLNRGTWRDVEHRIAEFWTRRWDGAWVIVGSISTGKETLFSTKVNVPEEFYQIVVVQHGDEIRAVAMLFPQTVGWRDWPARYMLSIDELENRAGLDFFTELDDATEEELESQTPTRLLPTRFLDAFKMLWRHGGP